MKMNKIRLVGAKTVDMPLEGVGPLSPYVLKAADGLGPVGVDVSIDHSVNGVGTYQGRRPLLRQVVLRVGLQPEWNIGQTPQELRTDLYTLLTPRYGDMVYLYVMLGESVIAFTAGHISKLEISTFSKDPEVQITLDCTMSHLRSYTSIQTSPPRTVVGSDARFTIDNSGTAPTPFVAEFKFKTAKTGVIRLSDNNPYGGQYIAVEKDFAIDDVLVVDTRPGTRGVWRKLAGTSTTHNILGSLDPGSTWLTLHNGENILYFDDATFEWGTGAFKFQPEYWGI